MESTNLLDEHLHQEARTIIKRLRAKKKKLVLAESCTGGLASAFLTDIPGASEVFCGSHVSYRENSKELWIGVNKKTFRESGVVSASCAEQMALGALRATPESHLAVSITGYLGPTGQDIGLVYVGGAKRNGKKHSPRVCSNELHILFDAKKNSAQPLRGIRRKWAVVALFSMVRTLLK